MAHYLVIGGSSGIGRSLVEQLSEQGHHVYSTFHKHERKSSDTIHYQHLDVMADTIDLSFLPDQLDGLVYCPGSINLLPFSRIKPQSYEEDFQLQVTGAVKVLQNILPKLKKSESAGVLFFSTVAVQTGFNFHSQVAVSKGAIEGLTKALAAEFAPKIRVNAIAPSITNTPLASRFLGSQEKIDANAERHPLKKIGTPEDIANLACFLLSKQANWITGQILTVDGGISSLRV